MRFIARFSKILFLSFCLINCTNAQPITWDGKIISVYVPNMYSHWNTSALGGQIAFQYKSYDMFFTTVSVNTFFIPYSPGDKFDFSQLRSISLALSNESIFHTRFNALFSIGINYSEGKILNKLNKYPSLCSQVKFNYNLKEKIALFLSVESLFDFKNKFLTPSIKVGCSAPYIIFSFDFFQFINWENPALRINNSFAIPYINKHQ